MAKLGGIEADDEFIAAKQEHKKFIMLLLEGKQPTEAYHLTYPHATRSSCSTKGWALKEKYSSLLARQAVIPSVALERIASRTIDQLQQMAFADPLLMLDAAGKVLPLNQMPAAIRQAISEIKIVGDSVEIKFGGKSKALEILARAARLEPPSQPPIEINMVTEEDRDKRLQQILTIAQRRINDEGEDSK